MFRPTGEDLGEVLKGVQKIVADLKLPSNVRVVVRGSAHAMQVSFRSFGLGLILATVLVYLILVAQFKSFMDPLLILLAVPTGLTGVLIILFATGTTLNVMSLMGVVMMVGIVVSNSILIVEFTNRLRAEGRPLREAVSLACRVRLRPVLMTSLATLIGLIPMALKLGTGSEAYAPLARAIIGGLAVSVVLTVFIVPAAYFILYRRKEARMKDSLTKRQRFRIKHFQMKRIILALSVCACLAGNIFADGTTNAPVVLTLADAAKLALQNHPQIAAANYRTLAAQEAVKETRSGYFPKANLYADAVGANDEGTRIMAGGLNNPSVFDRGAGGVAVSQLITDFGRTANLTASSKFQAQAENQNANATREQVLLQVNVSYFGALEAQAVLHVAQQTVDTRQLLLDQVSLLASNKLRSELDVSFARVAVQEGKLLLQKAQNDVDDAMTSLSTALGYREPQPFQLVESSQSILSNTNEVSQLVETALAGPAGIIEPAQ